LIKKLNLPRYVKDTAWTIYKSAVKKNYIRGRGIKNFLAASVFAATRMYDNTTRTPEEIIKAMDASRRLFYQALELIRQDIFPELNLEYKAPNVREYVNYFCNALGRTGHLIDIYKILNSLAEDSSIESIFSGKDPKGVAAALIYIYFLDKKGLRLAQAEMSKIARITEVTLRARVSELMALYKSKIKNPWRSLQNLDSLIESCMEKAGIPEKAYLCKNICKSIRLFSSSKNGVSNEITGAVCYEILKLYTDFSADLISDFIEEIFDANKDKINAWRQRLIEKGLYEKIKEYSKD